VRADPSTPKSTKGEQTRELIMATALRLFREDGYEATTMRRVAQEAGVSVGNAYYYFASKEHLTQGFYGSIIVQHLEVARPLLQPERDLAVRLRIALRSYVELVSPYHRFATGFFQHAAAPTSPLSPFSPESATARQAEIDFFAEVIDGSSIRIPRQLRADLPELLWLHLLGTVLYWVHDASPGQARTLQLIDRSAPLVVKLIGLSRLPGTKGVLEDLLELLHTMRPV
jgi:AcrR family transcriptional regulator